METAFFSGGSQQIRTAVDGFADRYLTTRSGNHFRFALQRYNFFLKNSNYLHAFSFLLAQFLCFSFFVVRFKPLNLQSAVQFIHAGASG